MEAAVTEDGGAVKSERDASPAISLVGVSRSFDGRQVLEDIDLRLDRGQIFGLVGPSGSGKTTVVRLIVGLLEPSEGDVWVEGVRPADFRPRDQRRIGYMPQQFSLFPTLTVQENARFMASLYGVGWLARRARIQEVLSFLELWDARKRLAHNLSGGMQRRLSLAGAILHQPSLLVVDEPTAGLDPVLRRRIWDHLNELKEAGTTLVITTQYIEEAERCDVVGILSEGKLRAHGSPYELRAEANLPDVVELEISGADLGQAVYEVQRLDSVRTIDWDGSSRLEAKVDDLSAALPEIHAALETRGCSAEVVNTRQASFEEVFMRYTGQA